MAMETLVSHSWPGNVRELRNTVVRAACLAQGGEISVQDLPEDFWKKPAPAPTLSEPTMMELEQQAIYRALTQCGGNQDRAAQILGISRRTLIRRLKSYRDCFDADAAMA